MSYQSIEEGIPDRTFSERGYLYQKVEKHLEKIKTIVEQAQSMDDIDAIVEDSCSISRR